jgi:hypothetical protein
MCVASYRTSAGIPRLRRHLNQMPFDSSSTDRRPAACLGHPSVRHWFPFRAQEDEFQAIGMKSSRHSLQKIDNPREHRKRRNSHSEKRARGGRGSGSESRPTSRTDQGRNGVGDRMDAEREDGLRRSRPDRQSVISQLPHPGTRGYSRSEIYFLKTFDQDLRSLGSTERQEFARSSDQSDRAGVGERACRCDRYPVRRSSSRAGSYRSQDLRIEAQSEDGISRTETTVDLRNALRPGP